VADAAYQALVAGLRAPLTDRQRGQLAAYAQQLLRWNQTYNLTAIASPQQLVRRHIAECLALAPLLVGARIADMGSGAGLPGLVLATAEPEREFWLLESVGKKTRFLTHMCGELALTNVHVYHGRIEDFPLGAPFDTVVARALAPVERLVQLAQHLLGEQGKLVALKGDKLEAELLKLPAGFYVETITTLASMSPEEPPPRAVIIRPVEAS
jgi:16S rRNA (guanine527-N7)-methyltransferase